MFNLVACGAIGERNLRRHLLAALIGLIVVIPIWIPTFPAMCDVPQHAALVAIYSQLGHPGFAYSQMFVRHIQTPNLAGYALLFLFKPMIGLVAACKLTVSAALLGFLLATSGLIAEFGGDPLLALLAVLGIYGYPFQWGLIAFLVAAPLGICFLILAVRYFRSPTVGRGVALAMFFLFVFFCHAMVAAYAAGLAAVYALADLGSVRHLFQRWLPMLATVPAAGLWWVHSVSDNPVTHRPTEWELTWDRFPNFFTNITGWPSDPLAAFFVVAAVVPLIVLLGLRRQRRFYVPFACCVATAFFAPHCLLGIASIYERHALFLLPCAALTLAPATMRRARLASAWLLIVVLGWTAGMAWRMNIFEREARGFSTLLRQMEPGQRMLSINFSSHSSAFAGAVFLHYPVWYSALKGGIVDPSFASGNVDLLVYRPEEMPAVRFADFEFHPESFNWHRHQAWRYRYFVVHAPTDMSQKLFAAADAPVLLRSRDGDWWLYENTAAEGPPSDHSPKALTVRLGPS